MRELDSRKIHRVLGRHGITVAYRNVTFDPTDFVIFLEPHDYETAKIEVLTRELMEAIPHSKIWVTRRSVSFPTALI
jgi:hypothetical protein